MKNGEQQAYPSTTKYKDGNTEIIDIQSGLTKREYFAGLAMQGILANPNVGKIIDGERFVDKIAVSQSSVIIADEILKQLEK